MFTIYEDSDELCREREMATLEWDGKHYRARDVKFTTGPYHYPPGRRILALSKSTPDITRAYFLESLRLPTDLRLCGVNFCEETGCFLLLLESNSWPTVAAGAGLPIICPPDWEPISCLEWQARIKTKADTTYRLRLTGEMALEETPCPDCQGTGRYVGLTKEEPCSRCQGKGAV